MRNGNGSLFVPTPATGSSSKQTANTEFVSQAIGSAALSSFVDFVSGLILSPTNQDYRLIERLPFAITVTSFSGKTSTGTITAALSIGTTGGVGTAITGGSLNASSTQTTVTPTALNTAAIASALVLTGSVATSPQNLSFIVVYTRAP